MERTSGPLEAQAAEDGRGNCIFCRIADHTAPGSIVYEDKACVAFLDVHPIGRGHTLVIPREHCPDLFELDDAAGQAVIVAAGRVARALRETLRPDGLNLLQSNGRAAGQTVFHFHFHIVPRWARDGLFLPHHPPTQAERSALDELAESLRRHL